MSHLRSFVVLLAGCNLAPTSTVATEDMVLEFDVRVPANGAATTRAAFRDVSTQPNHARYATLDAGDVIKVYRNNGATAAVAQDKAFLEYPSYTNRVDGTRPNDEFRMALTRSGGSSAPQTVVSIPPRAVLIAPAAGTRASRTAQLEIRWDRGDGKDDITIEITGAGLNTAEFTTKNTGAYTVPAGAIAASGSGTVDASIAVGRTRIGVADPAFSGGVVRAMTADVVGIQLTP